MTFGQLHVAPILRDYLDVYPSVSAFTLFVDQLVEMIDEGNDLIDVTANGGGVRMGRMQMRRQPSIRGANALRIKPADR